MYISSDYMKYLSEYANLFFFDYVRNKQLKYGIGNKQAYQLS